MDLQFKKEVWAGDILHVKIAICCMEMLSCKHDYVIIESTVLYRTKMVSEIISPPPASSCPLITGIGFRIRAENREHHSGIRSQMSMILF